MMDELCAAHVQALVRHFAARLTRSVALIAVGIIALSCVAPTEPPRQTPITVLWRVPLERGEASGAHLATDGRRLSATYKGVSAFDAASGILLWRMPLALYRPRNLVVRGNTVFAAETEVFAFDAETGAIRWRTPVPGGTGASADFAEADADDELLYVGTRDHHVHALTLADGRIKWSVDVGPDWPEGMVSGIKAARDTVYVTARRLFGANTVPEAGVVVALDRRDGRILWTHQYGSGLGMDLRYFTRAPSISGRILIAADRGGNSLVALDRFTGTRLWRFDGSPGYVGFTHPPEIRGDTVFAASADTYVYAIHIGSGRLLWRSQTPAANEGMTLCGTSVLANYQGIAVIGRRSGRVEQLLLDGDLVGGACLAAHRGRLMGRARACQQCTDRSAATR